MNIVAYNAVAADVNRQFKINSKSKQKSTEKLSSGYRINRSADDAAGLSISEKMRNQIRNLTQATKNVEDGISLIHTADGVLSETDQILHRIEELSVKAANDTYTEDDRSAIDDEIQALKQEISDSLYSAQFNGKYLFREPYLPEITGDCTNFQVFNDYGATGVNGYGGVSVNNIRYTWDEMGVSFNSDGTFKDDYKFYHTDAATGESIEFQFKRGGQPTDAKRIYRWEATDDGITINNLLAVKWEDIDGLDVNNPSPGLLSFDYDDMHITFQSDAYTMDDLKKGINGKGFDSDVYWVSSYTTYVSEKAVDLIQGNQRIRVRDTARNDGSGIYKNDIMNVSSFYTLHVDEQGVQLRDIMGDTSNHTFIKWSDFANKTSVLPNDYWTTTTDYPIVDWGENNDNSIDTVTFDHDATYFYKDEYTGIQFYFKLADEASFEKVQAGMDLKLGQIKTNMSYSTYADSVIEGLTAGSIGYTDAYNSSIKLKINSSYISYDSMLNGGRDFEDSTFNFDDDVSVIENKDAAGQITSYTYSYTLNASGETISTTIDAQTFDELLKKAENDDQSLSLILGSSNSMYINASYNVENFQNIVSVTKTPSIAANAIRTEQNRMTSLRTSVNDSLDGILKDGLLTDDEKLVVEQYMKNITDALDCINTATNMGTYQQLTSYYGDGYVNTDDSLTNDTAATDSGYNTYITDRENAFNAAQSQYDIIKKNLDDIAAILQDKADAADVAAADAAAKAADAATKATEAAEAAAEAKAAAEAAAASNPDPDAGSTGTTSPDAGNTGSPDPDANSGSGTVTGSNSTSATPDPDSNSGSVTVSGSSSTSATPDPDSNSGSVTGSSSAANPDAANPDAANPDAVDPDAPVVDYQQLYETYQQLHDDYQQLHDDYQQRYDDYRQLHDDYQQLHDAITNLDIDTLSSRLSDSMTSAYEKILRDETTQLQYNTELSAYRANIKTAFLNSQISMHTNSLVYVDVWNIDEYTQDNISVHSMYDYQYDDVPPERKCIIQSGANEGEDTTIRWQSLNLTRLGLGGVNCKTREGAVATIARTQNALKIVNQNRSRFGAMENRLEKEYNNNTNYNENLQSAESTIRDTDMSEEITANAKHEILLQAAQAMMAQANSSSEYVLNLLNA